MSNKLKTLLSLAIFTLLFTIGVSGVLYTFTKKNLTQSISLATQIQQEQNRANQAKDLVSFLAKTKDAQLALKSYILSDAELVTIIEAIEKLGVKTGVNVVISGLDADDSSNSPEGTINKAHARIDIKGSWEGVIKFVTLIEHLPYKSSISQISLRKSDIGDKKSSIWAASFLIEILKIK